MTQTYQRALIEVSTELPTKNGGRSAGFDLKSSIMEIIDNSIDAGNSYIHIQIDTNKGITTILNDEKGLDFPELKKLLSVGKSGDYGSDNIGNYGLGAFYALTFLGENGTVDVETTLKNEKIVAKLNFKSDKPMEYQYYTENDPNNDNLYITCKTNSYDIFDSVQTLGYDLGAHYHDILKTGTYTILLKIDDKDSIVVTPIDPFYRESEQTEPWDYPKTQTLIINDTPFDIEFQGYYISRNTNKNELDKKGKKGFPHDYQGIYISLNGRILKLGNGWGIDGTNNKWVGGRMLISINTSDLLQKDKESVLKHFGITSNKNNPTLQISEKSIDKKELREIIKKFRSWVDGEYDRFNKEKKSLNPKTTTKKELDDKFYNLPLISTDIKNIKNYVLLEKMFPELVQSITEVQEYVKSTD